MSQLVNEAARMLADGGCIVYPTETFFALGARAADVSALERIAAIKARPAAKPLPLLLSDMAHLVQVVPAGFFVGPLWADFTKLTQQFWPGPLSLVVPCREDLPGLVKDEAGLVSVRFTPHPTAAALCQLVGGPLVATSANRSGRPPVAQADALDPEVASAVDTVVTEGPTPAGGPASTVAGVLGERRLRLFREGAVVTQQLLDAGFTIETP